MEINYQSIGTIYSPFDDIEGMPVQPTGAENVKGRIEVLPKYSEGLKDLDGFSHIVLLFHLHEVRDSKMIVTPFLDTEQRGVFATRSPKRPNSIGLSVVKLIGVEQNTLHIENVDILNQTPLLDIKPYVPEFDRPLEFRLGWLEKVRDNAKTIKSDGRFR